MPNSSARRRNASTLLLPPAHSRQVSAGIAMVWTWSWRASADIGSQRRPHAGSMTCTQPPNRRQITTKCIVPFGVSVTAIAGSTSLLGQPQVVDRQHDLFGRKPELTGDLLDRVDGGAVERGLTGLAQVGRSSPECRSRPAGCSARPDRNRWSRSG